MTVHYYKMRQILLQNTAAILLQNAAKVYYKMRQFYYKMRQFCYKIQQLLQNAMFIINYDSTITNVQNKESKELLFRINLSIKLADGRMPKKGKNFLLPYLQNCQSEPS